MITIVITACSILAAPDPQLIGSGKNPDCQDFRLPFFEEISQMQCMVHSPIEVARWWESNQNWIPKRWYCETDDDNRRDKGKQDT